MTTHHIDGPYFEDFTRDQTFTAPAVTVTDGHAAFYQAVTGDRLRLPLDQQLAARVTGDPRALVHPMLVVNLVNGQTTYASQHVKGNLFYRGLLLQRPVYVGDQVSCYCRTVRVGRTSIAVHVETWARRRFRDAGAMVKVTEGTFTFVALNDDGTKRAVPRSAVPG